jgi:regulator of protease activity HflC (stomatin/prohibitin superfamily)
MYSESTNTKVFSESENGAAPLYRRASTNEYCDQFVASIPAEARKYFVSSEKKLALEEILNKRSTFDSIYIGANVALRLYPLLRIKYASANEIIPLVRHGIHELHKGPGYFTSEGFMDTVSSPVLIGTDIIFGPIKLIYVRPGTLKYGLNMTHATPMLLEPGMHYFDDINIRIDTKEILLNAAENSVIPVGDGSSFKFIFVKTGSNAVINKANGQLEVVDAGIHFIEAPDTFKTFVSIQQEFVKILSTVDNKFLTADNIELDIEATLFYKVSNVKKAFTQSIKDNNDLYSTLLSQARALLTTLIRSEYFSNVGKKKMNNQLKADLKEFYGSDSVAGKSEAIPIAMVTASAISPTPSAPPTVLEDSSAGFQTIIRDIEPQFLDKMREYGDQFGFEVQSLRIENIHYADLAMRTKISQLSLKFAELAQQEATIMLERKVELAQAEREKQQLMIKVQGEAERKMVMFDNERNIAMSKNQLENDVLLAQVRAKTAASTIEAEVEAKNKLIKAEADAEYIRKIGEAEYEINQKTSSLPFAQTRIVTEAQKQALAGVQKVVYTNDQNLLMKPYMNLMDLETASKKQ